MHGKLAIFVLLCCAAAVMGPAPGQPVLREDKPLASRPAVGDLTGQLSPAAKVARLEAVCRATGRRYRPASFDRRSGRFVFKGLPGDAAYDLCIVTVDGAGIEGIDLSWHEARWLRLAALRRRQLGLPAETTHKFSRSDVRELLKYVRDLKDFTDLRRVLYLAGHGRRAVMLVEVMRTRPFHARRGDELIWRIELWYFMYHYGGWERVPNVERVLERRRISAAAWRKITKVYYPQLSIYIDPKGRSRPVTFHIPERLDPARGRVAGTEPVQHTRAIILGLDEPASRPAGR